MREILFRGRGDTKYNDGVWYYGVPIRDFLAFLVNIEGCEVIGNVHDNPELLRGDANA